MEEIPQYLGLPRFPQLSLSGYIARFRGNLSGLHPEPIGAADDRELFRNTLILCEVC